MKKSVSLSKQITFVFICVVACIIALCFLANSLFLEKYYVHNKQKALLNAYNELNKDDTDIEYATDEFDRQLQLLCERYSLDVLVVDAESSTVKYMGMDPDELKFKLWDHLFGEKSDNSNDNEKRVLRKSDSFEICISTDARSKTKYIEMWGILDNDNLFLISSALEGVQDSVHISNKFLAYVGLASLLIGALVIIYVSRRISHPILELSKISNRIATLDFDAKYDGKEKNEIGILGENINKLSDSLQKTISELKTANNELRLDIEKKNEIDNMRKEFLANVSHELKTPIALIQGYAEGLQEDISEDPQDRAYYLEVITDEASKMNNMVQKLLTLNQLEFGNNVVTLERFDITALIEGCISSSRILIGSTDITITFSANEKVFVWGDEFMIEEVIMNYLSNAINHCDGEKVIEVTIVQNGTNARINVFNTGKNIPDESIEHIWDKFYKVDKARTRAYGGSGIGLSIVKAIMNAHNHDYGVVNNDKGVTFWFELDVE